MSKFKPISDPYMHGYVATRDDGIDIEIVRCYANRWNVFLTLNGNVVARSIQEHKLCANGYLSRSQALAVGKNLLTATPKGEK